jgi:peptidoglycan/LPS O-acetylase OafA/YrhL
MGEAGGPAPGRYAAVDAIKAAAIVAVVFTHARGELLPPPRSVDFWLCASWTPFQVPAFLFASGFLAAQAEPVSLARVGDRWLRVLLPYLVASAAAYLTGVARAGSLADLAFQLATASPLGVYYYVFLIATVSPLAWPLSRGGRRAAWGLLAVCAVAMLVLADRSRSGSVAGWFWSLRNPLDHFSLGFFLLGWLSRLRLAGLERAWTRHRGALAVAIVAGLALGPLGASGALPPRLAIPARVGYTLAVVGGLAVAMRGRPVGAAVRLLGDASLAIYLFHRIFQRLLEPRLSAWPEPAGTLALALGGLGGGVAVALLARLGLGQERARRWLGA